MAKRKQKLQIKIVFDTNAIWTRGESFLLKREMSELVAGNQGDAHLDIEWILPEVVLGERIYQMQLEAIDLLPNLSRLERVIGHPLNITEDIVKARISEAVQRQVEQHQLTIRAARYAEIQWESLVTNAINRIAPFDTKTEKGFRDSLIAETFSQLVADTPDNSQRFRVVLLTTDTLLAKAVSLRVSGRNNVQVLGSVDELKGLLNTLISTVSEDYVEQLRQKAKDYYFKADKPNQGIVHDLNIQSKVETECKEQLDARPEGTYRRSNGNWVLLPPRFVKKEGQRVFWTSRFSIEAKAYKLTTQSVPTFNAVPLSTLVGAEKNLLTAKTPWYGEVSTGLNFVGNPPVVLGSPLSSLDPAYGGSFVGAPSSMNFVSLGGNERLAATGKTIVDVNWSVLVNIKGVFSKPKLEAVEFIETTWENVP